jgi:hypothetical protein
MRKLLILSLLCLPLTLRGETSKLPPEKELKALALDTLLAFDKAVQEKSFAQFHKERLSPLFQKEFPLEKFSAAFQVFIEKGYEISSIARAEPVFDSPPAIDSNGVLVLKGHYATRPNKVTFKLSYVREGSAWKVLGINAQVVPFVENTATVPSDKDLRGLALDSLLAFNKSIQAKSFESFYGRIANLWRKETTPEALLKIFQPFIDQKVDIAAIAKLEPAFDGTPKINDDGFLVLKGSYPTKPSKVSFELKYVFEEEAWKMVGINVQVKPPEEKADGKKSEEKKSDDDDEENEEEGE